MLRQRTKFYSERPPAKIVVKPEKRKRRKKKKGLKNHDRIPMPKIVKDHWANNRKSKELYDPVKTPELAYKFCLLGATDDALSYFFGVDIMVIQKWRRTRPEFDAAVMEGRDFACANIAKSIYNRALGYEFEERTYERVKVLAPSEESDPPKGEVEILDEPTVAYEMRLTKKQIKHQAADMTAARYFLWNRTKKLPIEEQWGNERQEVTGKDGTPLIQNEAQQRTNDEKARKTREAMLLALGNGNPDSTKGEK